MSKQFAYDFYHSKAWQDMRSYIIASRFGLCERCLKKGKISKGDTVHHKVYLTPENIHDQRIALGEDNLELLCRDCHAEEHRGKGLGTDRYELDEFGNVVL